MNHDLLSAKFLNKTIILDNILTVFSLTTEHQYLPEVWAAVVRMDQPGMDEECLAGKRKDLHLLTSAAVKTGPWLPLLQLKQAVDDLFEGPRSVWCKLRAGVLKLAAGVDLYWKMVRPFLGPA